MAGQPPARPSRRVVLTGTGLVCPGISSPAALVTAPRAQAGSGGRQPWFDPVPLLGPRGWKYFSPATRYLLGAVKLALAGSGFDPASQPADRMAAVIGTNFAASPVVARFDRVVIAEGSDALSPAEAPNFSVNIPASQVSARYNIRGFNLTLTNPVVAGLEAILTLGSALRAGQVSAGLAGATEECPGAAGGACCFVLEALDDARARRAAACAELAGGFSCFLPMGPDGRPLADLLEPALGDPLRALVSGHGHGNGPLPFACVSGSMGAGEWLGDYCASTCAAVGVPLTGRQYPGQDGEHFTVSPLLQVAGLITEYGQGLIVGASPHGNITAVCLSGDPRGGAEEAGRDG